MSHLPFKFVYDALKGFPTEEVKECLEAVKREHPSFMKGDVLVQKVGILLKSRQVTRRATQSAPVDDLTYHGSYRAVVASEREERAIREGAELADFKSRVKRLTERKVREFPEHYESHREAYEREAVRSKRVADYGYHPEYNR